MNFTKTDWPKNSDLIKLMKKEGLGRGLIDEIDDYIREKFALPMRDKLVHDKNAFDKKISSKTVTWKEIRELIEQLDQNLIAKFWSWYEVSNGIQKLVVDKQDVKTHTMKMDIFTRLKGRKDLELFTRVNPDDFVKMGAYIRKN